MKTRFLLSAIVAMTSFWMSTNAFAQIIPVNEVEIDWATYASTLEEALASSGNVYLYAPAQPATGNKAGFLAMQGEYGVSSVLKDIGSRLKIETYSGISGVYAIKTNIYCGTKDDSRDGYWGLGDYYIYFDNNYKKVNKDKFRCRLCFWPTETSGSDKPTYKITNGGYNSFKCESGYHYNAGIGGNNNSYSPQIKVTTSRVETGETGGIGSKPKYDLRSIIYDSANNQVVCSDAKDLGNVEHTWVLDEVYKHTLDHEKAQAEAKAAAEKVKASYEATAWAECITNLSNAIHANTIKWYIIAESDYKEVIKAQTTQTYINITSLTADPRFDRNDKDQSKWTWQGTANGSYIGWKQYVGGEKLYEQAQKWGAFYAAEVTGQGTLTQTVTVPKPGLYAISCQGFYVGDGANGNSYLYAQSGSKSQQVLLSKISSTDAATFNSYSSSMRSEFGSYADGYFNANVAAGRLLANDNIWSAPENTYVNSVYIYVEPVDGWETNGIPLTYGVNKTSTTGAAYVDNFKLIYAGQEEILFDERATEQDNKKCAFPTTLNLRRTFTLNAWNPIILPMAFTGSQLKQAFGDDVKLSILDGLTTTKEGKDLSHCINFKTVDLENGGLEPNKCYIIWVTRSPDVLKGSSYTTKISGKDVTIAGPAYRITVQGQDSYQYANPVTGKCTTTDGIVNYVGYYAKQTGSYSAGDFVMDKGNMYHLQSAWGNYKYASEWSLTVSTKSSASSVKFVMSIDGKNEGDATGIINIEMTDDTLSKENTAIYNLSGQKVGDDVKALPKGLYIRNGRKFLVK